MNEQDVYEIAARARLVGMCAYIAPPIAPGLLPYFCALPIDHTGVHLARDLRDGTVYDSWPQ